MIDSASRAQHDRVRDEMPPDANLLASTHEVLGGANAQEIDEVMASNRYSIRERRLRGMHDRVRGEIGSETSIGQVPFSSKSISVATSGAQVA